MKVMDQMKELLKTAMAYAGAVGQCQGFIAFVKNNPDYYSREELVAKLIELSDEVNAKLEEVGEQ